MHPLADLAPFRCSVTDGEFPVTVDGDVPAELAGRLIRTTPSGLSTDNWHAEHWFDGEEDWLPGDGSVPSYQGSDQLLDP
jgi:carotenoid cleavage dioxygenase-like enzyme